MGGAEINLTQADIQDRAVIEATQIFGGTKIIVPPHWNVKSEVIAVFGGIDDKRPMQAGNLNPEKTLVLRGISVFGGIDIRSY
ncbi:MAG: LiaF domain-containing protein [Segetibacter sp.]